MLVAGQIELEVNELQWEFVRSGGPGGQNVNKVATAVQLKFNVASSPSLPEDVKARISRIAGRRMTMEGVLIIKAQRFRSQERNRDDAIRRLTGIIEGALRKPKRRVRTKPTASSRARRLESKHRSGMKKGLRHAVSTEE